MGGAKAVWPLVPGPEGRPLYGTRVLDVSRVLAGPHCTMVLADFGANVIKAEPPSGDETRRWGPPFFGDTAAYYFVANRNKRSVVLDLKTKEGRHRLKAFLAEADVLVQNFTGQLATRFEVDADSVHRINPDCIHLTLSGFGPSQADRRGYDLLAQALGGLMSVTGEKGGRPLKVGVPIADITAGTYAASAVMAALLQKSRTGHVARIEVALTDAVASLLANQAMNWILCGVAPEALGNDHPNVVPYGVFEAADASIVVAVASDAQFQSLCQCLGRSDLARDSRFATNADRVQRRTDLVASLTATFASASAQQWIEKLTQVGIACGRVQVVASALSGPDVWNVSSIDHPEMGRIGQVISPVRFDGEYLEPYLAPPRLNEHHQELIAPLDDQND